ncbi:MAG: tRNA lysidine(34) synthetase TilS [Alphaproteobacteria bacterium]
MNQNFKDFIQKYLNQPIAVAVSGGVDSVCLLCWLAEIHKNVVCLHVNHGLRAAADTETQYVVDLCGKLNVPCKVFYWTGEKPQTGLEAAARDARYKMMTDYCHENGINYLMVAHQADDQIETFLMNLGRGSGIYGLAAMKRETMRDGITIVRPLLSVFRAEIKKDCDDNNIKYFKDEMNDDTHYTRVNIRKNRHVLSELLGISDARLMLAIENLGRLRDSLDDDINYLVDSVCHRHYAMFSDSFLFDLTPDNRLKFIGTLIQKIGGDNYPPRLKSLVRALDNLSHETQFTLGHCTLRRLKSKILIVPEGDKTTFRKKYEKSIQKR